MSGAALVGCKSSGGSVNSSDVKAAAPGWSESHDVNSKEVATAAFGVTNSCFAKAQIGVKVWSASSTMSIDSFASQMTGTLKKLSADSTDFADATTSIFSGAKASCGDQIASQAMAQTKSSYGQFLRDASNSAYVLKHGAGASESTSILFVYTNESNMPELMQLDNGVK